MSAAGEGVVVVDVDEVDVDVVPGSVVALVVDDGDAVVVVEDVVPVVVPVVVVVTRSQPDSIIRSKFIVSGCRCWEGALPIPDLPGIRVDRDEYVTPDVKH